MKYALTLYWNGEVVMHGVCTAAVAVEMIKAHIDGNFGVADESNSPSLKDIRGLVSTGMTLTNSFGDETGRVGYAVSYLAM